MLVCIIKSTLLTMTLFVHYRDHMFFHALTFAGPQGCCLNTRPICRVIKHLLRDPVSQFILPPGQLAPRGASQSRLACPPGASCPGISCPPPWLSSPPGGKLSRPVYLAPRPTQVKNIYMLFCYFSVSF